MQFRRYLTRCSATAAVAVLGFSPVWPAAAASASAVGIAAGANLEGVSVYDTADVLNDEKIKDAMAGIDFNEPTKVAVFSREGKNSDDINTETLTFARDAHPEWISQDPEDYGDYWADGYFIITLSVEGPGDGQIGTYFGEDRKVSTGQMESIHKAGYEDFNLSRWTDGVIAVGAKGAKIMNRPWYKNPALWITTGVAGGAAGVTSLVAFGIRASRRKEFAAHLDSGREHLGNVSMDLDATELSARTLPSGSRHAADLERRFADFMVDYRSLFTRQQELEAATKKTRSSTSGVARSKDFNDTAQQLDATDDAIIAAAALYTRSATWQDAWRAQAAPILEDLEELPQLLDDTDKKLGPAGSALRSFAATAQQEVQDIGTDLAAQAIDVDTALDRLSELRKQLTERLEAYATARIGAYAKSKAEEKEMRESMRQQRYAATGSRGGGSILDVTSPAELFWRVGAFNIGYHSAVSAVDSSRQAASSSSGVSSGYSGGGSFSGAGGSSRF
ncbi:DUF5129 domain-containing protein [Glutamicibacter protophormiae]|uniref:DUF5129 domain-containing protein n=1 Tax=Glutamicibacter protophormiae TaxID=37930 RepID=UPI002A80CED1|nr:DUF5129 domain-containing protein [Glutamicibacter protophormiae]WPR65857.1 DUF5129 domain-containing protein [Glutamicibacter protophormiae]WPR69355.1 DUF5129 domain-containing protein [Glutamicibacter protophormiae]